jgi:hypothetical protein
LTETLLSSPAKEVVIGFERPFVVIGERINPTGRKALAAEMAAGCTLGCDVVGSRLGGGFEAGEGAPGVGELGGLGIDLLAEGGGLQLELSLVILRRSEVRQQRLEAQLGRFLVLIEGRQRVARRLHSRGGGGLLCREQVQRFLCGVDLRVEQGTFGLEPGELGVGVGDLRAERVGLRLQGGPLGLQRGDGGGVATGRCLQQVLLHGAPVRQLVDHAVADGRRTRRGRVRRRGRREQRAGHGRHDGRQSKPLRESGTGK